MEEKKVSLIVPAYNVEKYVRKCIESIINQTYKNWEVIIINDGSTDHTGQICDHIALSDKRIRVFHIANGGVSAARNLGMKYATGRFVGFIDADDYVFPTYVEDLIHALIKNNTSLGIIDYYSEKNGVRITNSPDTKECMEMTSREVLESIYDHSKFAGYLWNKLFDLHIIRAHNIAFREDIKIWEDLLFCIVYITKIEKAGYCRKPSYVYVQRNDSVMNHKTSKKEPSKLIAMECIYRIAQKYGGQFQISAATIYGGVLISEFYLNRDSKKEKISDKRTRSVNILKTLPMRLSVKQNILYQCIKYTPHLAYFISIINTKRLEKEE